MNKTLVIIIIIIITSLLAGFFFSQVDEKSSSSIEVAIFDNELVTEDLLKEIPMLTHAADASEDDIKKLKLARYVENRLLTQLATEYNVDQSKEAVFAFIKGKLRPINGQENAQKLIVQAMREVIINGRGEDDVYNEFFLNKKRYPGLTPSNLSEWKESLDLYGKKEIIEFYEQELKKKANDISTPDFIFYKKRYLEKHLKSAYCESKNVASNIFKSLAPSSVTKNPRFVHQRVEYKCNRLFYPWLLNEVENRVAVKDKRYKGFEKYLSSYTAVQFMKANDTRAVGKK
ncbi:MAG: hypothetical protein Q9M46_04715 [Ghiorsea sp.]|nr:hypothetical protein [Ghiorsea sp.]